MGGYWHRAVLTWMRDRVDYCASLLRKWPSDRPVGSNPTASAVDS